MHQLIFVEQSISIRNFESFFKEKSIVTPRIWILMRSGGTEEQDWAGTLLRMY
jgi:hypothetical protein